MRPAIPLLVLLLGAGCASGRVPPEKGPVGCWASNRPDFAKFELTFDTDSGEPVFRPNDWGDYPIESFWMPIEMSDSVRINYGYGGFSGETVRALVTADSMSGISLPFTDLVGGPPPRPVEFRAERVDCAGSGGGSV